jgi:DNA-directed RNA polymerase specialized sigma24 family protein
LATLPAAVYRTPRARRLPVALRQARDEAEGGTGHIFSAFEAIDRFEGRAGLGTWLYRIATAARATAARGGDRITTNR